MEIKNIQDFLNLIESIKSEKTNPNRLIFRGQSDNSWELKPSIFRDEFMGNESSFCHLIKLQNYEEIEKCNSEFEKLTVMQHYSVPTRLLDWTSNPLVAMFFAIEEDKNKDKDGKIFILNPPEFFLADSLFNERVEILTNLTKNKSLEDCLIDSILHKKKIRDDFSKFFSKQSTSEKINNYNQMEDKESNIEFSYNLLTDTFDSNHQSSQSFNEILKPNLIEAYIEKFSEITFILPKINNSRLRAQSGLFSFHGNKIEGTTIIYDKMTSNNITKYTSVYKEVTIKNEHKEKLLKDLKNLNIHRGTLFPELENYAQFLRKSYRNK